MHIGPLNTSALDGNTPAAPYDIWYGMTYDFLSVIDNDHDRDTDDRGTTMTSGSGR